MTITDYWPHFHDGEKNYRKINLEQGSRPKKKSESLDLRFAMNSSAGTSVWWNGGEERCLPLPWFAVLFKTFPKQTCVNFHMYKEGFRLQENSPVVPVTLLHPYWTCCTVIWILSTSGSVPIFTLRGLKILNSTPCFMGLKSLMPYHICKSIVLWLTTLPPLNRKEQCLSLSSWGWL